jgi:hypothetical protein
MNPHKNQVVGLPFLILTLSTWTVCPPDRRAAILAEPKSVRNGREIRDMADGCGAPTRRPGEARSENGSRRSAGGIIRRTKG